MPSSPPVKEFGKNTMSDTRRAKLEALRKRENDRAKEARQQQLEEAKAAARAPTASTKKRTLKHMPPITAALAKSRSAPAVAKKPEPERLQLRRRSKPKVLAPGEKLKVLEDAAGTLASDWSLLDAYNILEYKRSEDSKQAKKLAERDRMKTELRMQLAKKQESMRLKAINDKKQVEDIRKQNEAWVIEAREEKASRVVQLNREIQAREAMAKSRIDETQRRKALKDLQDLEELKKVKREIAAEEVKQKRRVVEERLRLEAIMAENVKEKAIREKAKHDQWEADKRMMHAYQANLDRVAKEREAEKAAKKRLLDAKALSFETSDQAKEMRAREVAEKARIESELARQAKAVEDRHIADREKIRREKELIKRDNDELIANKNRLRAQEEKEKARMFIYLKNSAKENEELEDRKQEVKALKKKKHFEKLQEQIEACRNKRENYNMTEKERGLNEDRIEKLKALAKEDPQPIVEVLSVFPVKAGITRPAVVAARTAPRSKLVEPPVEKPPPPRRPPPFRLDTDGFMAS